MKRRMLPVLLLVILSLCISVLSGCGASRSEDKDAAADPAVQEEGDDGKDAGAEAESEDDKLQPGEVRYSGTSSTDEIESITVSFILSEDKGSIHDLTIVVNGFKGEAQIPGATVSVEVTGVTQTIMSTIEVDYEGENRDLPAGDSTIESLTFNDDGTADMVFTYCFKQTSPQQYEIPVSGIEFDMTSK